MSLLQYYTGALIVKSTREYKKQSKLNYGMNFQSSFYHEYDINIYTVHGRSTL